MRKLFSLAGFIGLLLVGPAKAALIYDSINGAAISNASGGISDSLVANAFEWTPGSGIPDKLTVSLSVFGPQLGDSAIIYLAPDLGPTLTAPNGPNFGKLEMVGQVSENSLSTDFHNPTDVSFWISPLLAEKILSETYASEFWVVLETGTSSIVWSNN